MTYGKQLFDEVHKFISYAYADMDYTKKNWDIFKQGESIKLAELIKLQIVKQCKVTATVKKKDDNYSHQSIVSISLGKKVLPFSNLIFVNENPIKPAKNYIEVITMHLSISDSLAYAAIFVQIQCFCKKKQLSSETYSLDKFIKKVHDKKIEMLIENVAKILKIHEVELLPNFILDYEIPEMTLESGYGGLLLANTKKGQIKHPTVYNCLFGEI